MKTHLPFATLFSLSLVLLLDGLVMGIVFPMMGGLFIDTAHAIVPLQTSLAHRDIWYSVAMASFFIFAIIGAPFLGDLSDHLGRRKVLLLSLFLNGISCLLCAVAITIKSPLLLVTARALAGLSAGNQPLAQAAMIDMSTPATKARNLSLISLAASVGFIVGPLIGGLLSNPQQGFSYQLPFEIAAIVAFLNAVALLMTFKETFIPRQQNRLRLLRGFSLLSEGFKHPKLRFWLYLFLIAQLAWGIYFQSLSLIFMQLHHFTTRQIGFLITVLSLSCALSLALVIPLGIKKLSLIKFLMLGLIIMALTMFAGSISIRYELTAWVTVIVVGISQEIIFMMCLNQISNTVNADQQGWAMGIATAIGSLSWGIAALVAGFLTNFSVHLPFLSAGLLLLSCWLAITINNRRRPL